MTTKKALIIFARKPELGKVKTRLAATIGEEKALNIYKKLLLHTREVAKEIECDGHIFLTEQTGDNFWEDFFIELQEGHSLGEKMEHAFRLLFLKKYDQCIIIGSDCPDLSTEIVNNAFISLQKNDVVIGAAKDGGYYLLGMNKIIPKLFQHKDWSTEHVFNQTINDLKILGYSYSELPMLNDVDEEKDIPLNWL